MDEYKFLTHAAICQSSAVACGCLETLVPVDVLGALCAQYPDTGRIPVRELVKWPLGLKALQLYIDGDSSPVTTARVMLARNLGLAAGGLDSWLRGKAPDTAARAWGAAFYALDAGARDWCNLVGEREYAVYCAAPAEYEARRVMIEATAGALRAQALKSDVLPIEQVARDLVTVLYAAEVGRDYWLELGINGREDESAFTDARRFVLGCVPMAMGIGAGVYKMRANKADRAGKGVKGRAAVSRLLRKYEAL